MLSGFACKMTLRGENFGSDEHEDNLQIIVYRDYVTIHIQALRTKLLTTSNRDVLW